MNDLKDVLDDAAADAVRELRIDLDAVAVRVARRRSRLRLDASRMLLLAAAVLVAAVLVPALVAVRPIRPAAGPTGLPAYWYAPPPHTPPVTRLRMAAASMILSAPLDVPGGTGAVLVSADGRRYAALPWSRDDGLAALSQDGIRVAWLTSAQGPGTRSMVLHLLRTASGGVRDVDLTFRLDGALRVEQLLWHGDDVYLRTYPDDRATRGVWRIDSRTLAVTRVCHCRSLMLGVDSTGGLVSAGGAVPGMRTVLPHAGPLDIAGTTYSEQARDTLGPPVASPVLAASGAATALEPVPDADLFGQAPVAGHGYPSWAVPVVDQEIRVIVGGVEPITDVRVLSWTDAGLLVRVTSVGSRAVGTGTEHVPSQSLRLIDPASGRQRIISHRRQTTVAEPVAVASGLVGNGATVPAPRPAVSRTDRGMVGAYLRALWRSNYPYWQLLALAVAAGLAVLGVRGRLAGSTSQA